MTRMLKAEKQAFIQQVRHLFHVMPAHSVFPDSKIF
jgi:hypothetical protein